MASFSKLYKTPPLSAKELVKTKTKAISFTIDDIDVERVGKDDFESIILCGNNGAIRVKLNKTNGKEVAKAFGDDYDAWVGMKVKVTVHKVEFNKAMTDGLLVTPLK